MSQPVNVGGGELNALLLRLQCRGEFLLGLIDKFYDSAYEFPENSRLHHIVLKFEKDRSDIQVKLHELFQYAVNYDFGNNCAIEAYRRGKRKIKKMIAKEMEMIRAGTRKMLIEGVKEEIIEEALVSQATMPPTCTHADIRIPPTLPQTDTQMCIIKCARGQNA